jgi:tRNA pseudouridine55 synthase
LSRRETYDFTEGELLLIDKAEGWTSFDAVNKIRHLLRHYLGIKKIKVGHAGTLDPLATGLLLVCTGHKTKEIAGLTGLDKEYSGTFFIGGSTPSFDRETEVDEQYDTDHISCERIYECASGFTGRQMQVPPAYSAIKVGGTRSYRMARSGESMIMQPREVFIREFDITEAGIPFTRFRVVCSKGTYIRSLANDFGRALSSGAYLYSLRRTRIGNYRVDNAISIQELETILQSLKTNG